MVLVGMALLEKEVIVGVEDEYGEGAVQPSFDVGFELVGRALRAIGVINQNDAVSHDEKRRGVENRENSSFCNTKCGRHEQAINGEGGQRTGGFMNETQRALICFVLLRLFITLRSPHNLYGCMHTLTIEGEGTFEVENGTRLVNAIEDHGIDISHRCGGQSSCTTCRVQFDDGEPEVMTRAEYEKLTDINQFGEFRLACQIVVDRDMTVTPLMRVHDENWDDPGHDTALMVEPETEWVPISTLEDEVNAADDEASDEHDDT